MRTGQWEPGFLVTRQRVHGRTEAVFRMTLGAIIAILRKELSLMMVFMAVCAFVMSEFQHTATWGLNTRLMAALTFHQRMSSAKLKVGEIMIELMFAHLIPAGRHMTRRTGLR